MDPADVPLYRLEEVAESAAHAVALRRARMRGLALDDIPVLAVDAGVYEAARGRCCENVVGVVPVPLGLAGPLALGGRTFHVPLATTEGALVASVSRGCRALADATAFLARGEWTLDGLRVDAAARVVAAAPQGMTRAPVFRAADAADAAAWCAWLERSAERMRAAFDATSAGGHARLRDVRAQQLGRDVHLRLSASTGGAMGMNVVTRGAEAVAALVAAADPAAAGARRPLALVAISGNACGDKKGGSAAAHALRGTRGHAVVAEAVLPAPVVAAVLKTTPAAIAAVVAAKCDGGTLLAGCAPHGANAQAANVVAAVFCATGQDLGHVGSSASAVVRAETCVLRGAAGAAVDALRLFATMPGLEMGAVGGGTALPAQRAALAILVGAPAPDTPDAQAAAAAAHTAAGVLAGELSLLAALAAPGDLLRAHMALNRRPHTHAHTHTLD